MPSRRLWQQLDTQQRAAVNSAEGALTSALYCEQRVGKTYITGALIERLLTPEFTALGIVPLTNLESTWRSFLGRELPGLNVCQSVEQFLGASPPKILLLHYEALPSIVKKLIKLKLSLIFYDESHRLKERGTLSSRIAYKLRDCATRKLILTGTPIDDSPGDMWAQFRFLKPDLFGTRWKDFEEEFYPPIPEKLRQKMRKARPGTVAFSRILLQIGIFKRKRKFRLDRLPLFHEKINPYVVRITKESVGIKKPSMNWEPVTLRGNQRILYEEVERDLFSKVGSARITAPLKVVQIAKLQQICGGYVFDDEGQVHEVGRAKLRRVLHLIKTQPKPLVIFCRYLEEVWAIERELEGRHRVATLTGRDKKNRSEVIKEFQSGKLDVLVSQERTGGVGVDLFRADTAIFFSITYSFIDFDQALSRIQVRNADRDKSIFLIYAQDTIDELIFETILNKRKLNKTVLKHLEKSWQKRKRSMALLNSQRSSGSSRRRHV